MRQHKLWLCALLVLLLAALGAFGAAAETTVGMSGAGSFKMEQVYVNVPELDVYFYALDGDGNSYSPIKVQAAGPELTLGDRRLEVRSVAAASDPICYILALDNSRLSFTDKDVEKATVKLTRRLVKGDTSYVTLIYGADVTDEQAEHVQALLSAKLSDKIEVMLVNGGQPVYYYIISVE